MNNKDRITSVVISLFVTVGYFLFFISSLKNSRGINDNWVSQFISFHAVFITLVLIFLAWIWLRKTTSRLYFNFLFSWVSANCIGGIIAVMFSGLGFDNDNYFMLPVFYAVLSTAQYLVLKNHLVNSSKWILFTVYGATIGLILHFLTSKILDFYSINLPFVGRGVLIGFSIGLAQWFFLKRLTNRASWWIAGSVISLTTVTLINYDCGCGPESIFSLLANIGIIAVFYGGIYGLISGLFLTSIIAPNIQGSDKVPGNAHNSDSTNKT